jgi:hypothetical protein
MKKLRGTIFYQASSRRATIPPGFCKRTKQCIRLVRKVEEEKVRGNDEKNGLNLAL